MNLIIIFYNKHFKLNFMELNFKQTNDIINILSKADGEDIQYILEQVGMSDQILKQLVYSLKIAQEKFKLLQWIS